MLGAEAHQQNRVNSSRHCFGNWLDRITYSYRLAWLRSSSSSCVSADRVAVAAQPRRIGAELLCPLAYRIWES
jgi:hypothetical protein